MSSSKRVSPKAAGSAAASNAGPENPKPTTPTRDTLIKDLGVPGMTRDLTKLYGDMTLARFHADVMQRMPFYYLPRLGFPQEAVLFLRNCCIAAGVRPLLAGPPYSRTGEQSAVTPPGRKRRH